MQRDDVDAVLRQFGRERACIVEAAHGHSKPRLQLRAQVDDETLGAARIEAEDDLEDAWRERGGGNHAEYRHVARGAVAAGAGVQDIGEAGAVDDAASLCLTSPMRPADMRSADASSANVSQVTSFSASPRKLPPTRKPNIEASVQLATLM